MLAVCGWHRTFELWQQNGFKICSKVFFSHSEVVGARRKKRVFHKKTPQIQVAPNVAWSREKAAKIEATVTLCRCASIFGSKRKTLPQKNREMSESTFVERNVYWPGKYILKAKLFLTMVDSKFFGVPLVQRQHSVACLIQNNNFSFCFKRTSADVFLIFLGKSDKIVFKTASFCIVVVEAANTACQDHRCLGSDWCLEEQCIFSMSSAQPMYHNCENFERGFSPPDYPSSHVTTGRSFFSESDAQK